MRESKIEAYLKKRAQEEGYEVRKVKWLCRNGAPDRVLFGNNGEVIWVELKANDGKPAEKKLTINQALEAKMLRERGHQVELIDSVELVDWLFS